MKAIDQAEKEIKEVLEKHKVVTGYEFTFPIYKILPDEVQLALKVLERHGMKVRLTLNPVVSK